MSKKIPQTSAEIEAIARAPKINGKITQEKFEEKN
jgi:hypothetical protein